MPGRLTRLLLGTCCLTLLAAGLAAEEAAVLGPPFVTVNGTAFEPQDSPALLTAGEVLLPINDLFAAVGGDVNADGAPQYTVARGAINIELAEEQLDFRVGDQEFSFYIAPVKLGRVLYLDARDVVTALGGEYVWDAATMTADLRLEVVGLSGNALKGTLVHLYVGPPPFFLVRHEDTGEVTVHAGSEGIQYFRADDEGRPQPTTLEDIHVGDYVEVSLDAAGKVEKVLTAAAEVSGVVEGIGGGRLLLKDGQVFDLAGDVKVQTTAGRDYDLNFIRRGDKVTLAVNPGGRTVVRLVVDTTAVAPEPSPREGPKILVVAPDRYTGPAAVGGRIYIRLRGTARGTATADIGDRVKGIALRENATGDYQGSYAVRAGDNITDAAITGHLTVAGKEAPAVVSEQVVTLDTAPPTFGVVSPADGQTIANPSPTVRVEYSDGAGSGVDPAQIQLALDGVNVTGGATPGDRFVTYQADNLAEGAHRLEITIRDRAGNAADQRTDFMVNAAEANKITAIRHDADEVLLPRGTVTVTMDVTEWGRKAYFVIGTDPAQITMARVSGAARVYRGRYVVREGDNIRDAKVVGHLVDNAGREFSMEATTVVNATSGLPVELAITAPRDGDKVTTRTLKVKGEAPPNRKVRVLITYNLFGDHVLVRDTATSDERGVWETKELDLQGSLVAMLATDFGVTAQLLGAADAPEVTKQVAIKVGEVK